MSKLEELEARRDRIEAQIKDIKAREAAKERKARNHAMMVLGGLLEQHMGGDWRAVDFEALDSALHRNEDSFKGRFATHGGRSTEDAAKALRDFERAKRDKGREAGERAAARAALAAVGGGDKQGGGI